MKRIFSLFASALIVSASALSAFAEEPVGYYSSLKGKASGELKTALYKIINPHTKVSSYNALPDYFKRTDVRPGTNYWWDMYSNMDVATNITFGTYMNREHSFPKSWWGGSDATPAYTDLFHLYPAESKANIAKSNYPLGIVTGNVYFQNGVTTVGVGATSGGAKYVFEPADEYKGDFARTYFYVVTCYQDLTWDSKYMYMLLNGTYPTLQTWASNLLLQWHKADPVSEKEINRNEAVFKIQNNRNPFIDHPELAEYIWGDKKGQIYNPSEIVDPTSEPTLITPTRGISLDFGEVALGKSVQSQLYFKGENFTRPIEFMIGGANLKYFSTSVSSIAASAVNATDGSWVAVNYTPTALGSHTARFLIYGDQISGSFTVDLRGTCLPVPTLTAPIATAATDISESKYTANWDVPADEVIDYYVVTRKRYTGASISTEEILAESNSIEIEGLDEGDYDTYSVHSVRLGCDSPESNEIIVNRAGIEGVEIDKPFIIESYPGGMRVRCSGTHHGLRVFDITGRVFRIIDTVEDGTEFSLPAGVYMIVTDSHRKPIKAIAY